MRQITKTRTGNIISDTDLELEYLYVGDYGKENNIKATFLGYDKRIDKVEHKEVDLKEDYNGCTANCYDNNDGYVVNNFHD